MAKRKSNKGNGALKKITTRARAIYNQGGTWKGAIKKASAEYRGGNKKSSPKKRKPARTKVYRRRKMSGIGSAEAPKQRLWPGGGKINTVNGIKKSGIGAAKSMLVADSKTKLAVALLRRDLATTKRDKKRIGKDVIRYRKQVKKYS